ncbi:MAG: trypsin-like peptidase domain-containing protein [Rhodothermales bacterium]
MDDAEHAARPVAGRGDGAPIPAIDHLSGVLQGTRQPLSDVSLHIGTSTDAAIHFPADREPAVATHHATLTQQGASYLLRAAPDVQVEVNGEPVTVHLLASGDIIKIGEEGPLLRFRLYREGHKPYKTIPEALKDCVDCARAGSPTPLGKAAIFLRTMPREVLTQTSPWSRGAILVLLALLLSTTGWLLFQTTQLQKQLAHQAEEVQSFAGLLEQAEENALSQGALREVRAQLESQLSEAVERVEALEARTEAGQRIIATAAQSVVFLQGSYGFVEPVERKPLRILLGPDGRPVTDAQGNPTISTGGTGPILERLYTGTAFVATEDGLLLTNKHVALPWEFDEGAKALIRQGLIPVMHRFIGYIPEVKEPFDVKLVLASETADVAVLRCSEVTGRVPHLPISEAPAQRGEEVFVLGYPTGMRALLARTNEAFVDSLMRQGGRPDFWTMARRLAEAGHIGPLATRGIIGQVTADKVVYDAETTSGGSGGPVIGLDGEVKAVNAAILVNFDGSNLGVPAAEALRLLDKAIIKTSGALTP